MRSVCVQRPGSFDLSIEFPAGLIPIFGMLLSNNDNGPVAALERPLPLLDAQPPSTTFNVGGTNGVETC